MTRPLVSAIVPVHQGERHLAEALASIRAQDYRPIEILVVDDGSTDGSAAIARSFPGVRLVEQPCRGVAAARNAALALAQGEFVAFLDQDDRWLPHKLARQMGRLLERPELGFVVAHERIVLDGVQAAPPWLRANALDEDLPVWLPGVLVARRSVFDRVGGFDPTYVNGSDTDWIYRARDAGVAHEVIPEALLLRRVHAANNSHRLDVNRREIFQALRASIARKRERLT